jgi:hypothetical protein
MLPEPESLQADTLRDVRSVQTVRTQINTVIARQLSIQKGLRARPEVLLQRLGLGWVAGHLREGAVHLSSGDLK